jgi:hypothetical protein
VDRDSWIVITSCVASIVAAAAAVAAVVIAVKVAKHDLRPDRPRVKINLGRSSPIGKSGGQMLNVSIANTGDLQITLTRITVREPRLDRYMCDGPGLDSVKSEWPPPDWPQTLSFEDKFADGHLPMILGVGDVAVFNFTESELAEKTEPIQTSGRATPPIYLAFEDGSEHCYQADLTPIWRIFKCSKEGKADFNRCFWPPLHTSQSSGEAGQQQLDAGAFPAGSPYR